jgi:hypothetical protein
MSVFLTGADEQSIKAHLPSTAMAVMPAWHFSVYEDHTQTPHLHRPQVLFRTPASHQGEQTFRIA